MNRYPQIMPAGDCAVVVEFANEISETINRTIRNYVTNLKEQKIHGINEIIPTFRSVLVQYDPRFISHETLLCTLKEVLNMPRKAEESSVKTVEIPVCYEGEYAPDIEYVAEHAGLSVEEVIKIHSSKDYLIYMLGFQPGFPYLGGLDERLFTPRLAVPRIKLRAGSVGIGGEQTGLYPLESPGGWQLIGTTPVKAYNPKKENPIPYEAGDYIRFVPISGEEFAEIEELEKTGQYEFRIYHTKTEK